MKKGLIIAAAIVLLVVVFYVVRHLMPPRIKFESMDHLTGQAVLSINGRLVEFAPGDAVAVGGGWKVEFVGSTCANGYLHIRKPDGSPHSTISMSELAAC